MKYFLFPILLCCALQAMAQRGLSTSHYTYVYKIPDDLLLSMYNERTFRPDIFTTPVDSFRSGYDYDYVPAPGNYLFVMATWGDLRQEIRSFHNIYAYTLPTGRGYDLVLLNKEGKAVHNATITRKDGLVLVKYQGVLNVFEIEKDQRADPYPIYLNKGKYRGYIAFSKPRYQPHDTVKVKAFITDRKGRPVNEPVKIGVYSNDISFHTMLTTLQPYRPGGYAYQFVLHDSIPLDKLYHLAFAKVRKSEFLMSEQFIYEQDHMTTSTLQAGTNVQTHRRHEPVVLTIRATDGPVKITVSTNTIYGYHLADVFVPDTLWQQTIKPAATGATKVELPDSIFNGAAFFYTIQCQSPAETITLQQQYTDHVKDLIFRNEKDSVFIDMMMGGSAVPDTGTLYMYNNRDPHLQLTRKMSVSLPFAFRKTSDVNQYKIKAGGIDTSFGPTNSYSIHLKTARHTGDSVCFEVSNPRQFPSWYTIYNHRKKVVAGGHGPSLYWKQRAASRKDYYIRISCAERNILYKAHYNPGQLHIALQVPDSIQPGQKSQVRVVVTDVKGKPVPDADITLYGMSAAFEDDVPSLPYYGGNKKELFNNVQYKISEPRQTGISTGLDHSYWESRMRLDTIRRFAFIYPHTMYRFDEPVSENVTQIAPYIYENGRLQYAQIVYIDDVPVYYFNAEQENRYSFKTTPGLHRVQVRTHDRLVTIDSFMVHKGVKNYVSVNPTCAPEGVTVTSMPNHLTAAEAAMLNECMVQIKFNTTSALTYLSQQGKYILLRGSRSQLVGPLVGRYHLVFNDIFQMEIQPKKGYYFEIHPGLIKPMEMQPVFSTTTILNNNGNYYNREDLAVTAADIEKIRDNNRRSFTVSHPADGSSGKLAIQYPADSLRGPLKIALRKYADSSQIRLASGYADVVYGLDPGIYKAYFMYANRYFEQDSILIKSGGTNYHEIRDICWQADKRLQTWEVNDSIPNVAKITRTIKGVIYDQTGEPMIGATVRLLGSKQVTYAYNNGEFELGVPDEGILYISYIGFEPVYIPLGKKDDHLVILSPVKKGIKMMDIQEDKAPALVRKAPAVRDAGEIRCVATMTEDFTPMKGNAVKAAFWAPTLRTDANGVVVFDTTFPDDEMNWVVVVLGMTEDQQAGSAIQNVVMKK